MSDEEEIRKLLKFRTEMEGRLESLEEEIEDLRRAISEIDRAIVRQGFRKAAPEPVEEEPSEAGVSSIKARDGTLLGTVRADDREVFFTPNVNIGFTAAIPPFQSFFIERVLSSMKTADEERATKGEISPDEALDFEVGTEGERITTISIHNYGGERRLREISSSLRWTLDKMYDKIRQG